MARRDAAAAVTKVEWQGSVMSLTAILALAKFWHWWIAGVLLLIVEVAVPGAFFLWMGVAAFITGLTMAVFPSMGWEYQFLIFAAFSVISIVVSRTLPQIQADRDRQADPEPPRRAVCRPHSHARRADRKQYRQGEDLRHKLEDRRRRHARGRQGHRDRRGRHGPEGRKGGLGAGLVPRMPRPMGCAGRPQRERGRGDVPGPNRDKRLEWRLHCPS